ncbi:SulP family inorganic anion transporter [Methylococcus sp. EFPC2]|uniref:SulP family inorganic anion transporter n=1 Tax=Methylococcus sp. EFPC2 TaxID=2812648 RepID=UPI0019670E71|nr:SulP family inorganic anion transporter [Methylococcus sp. EFPC2]QSA95598.1 SulP family inorganic anion transporter [Methylococcus sp. EFPC2]
MIHKHIGYYLRHLGNDIPAGLVVFLVALPLCLGVALASGAPLFSGIIAGIVGGLVVAWASGSQLSVSGPAAGLTVIVFHAIEKLGSFEAFLLSVMVAGLFQLVLGFLRAGVIGAYFPSAVIKGMLAAIGLILIMKQLPHAVGYDADFEGDETFVQPDAHTTFSELLYSLQALSPGAIIVSVTSILIMLAWDSRALKRIPVLSLLPGPLIAVLFGIGFQFWSQSFAPQLAIANEHLVHLPAIMGPVDFLHQFTFPDFSQWARLDIYTIAGTIAVVASLETLLSLEAADKIDPLKRVAPTNRELKAQGLGNLVSGFLGGIPLTAVIVRTSANVNAGGRTKMSAFVHGIFLLLSVMFLAQYLNLIPLACLAAVLLLTGYKLAKPALFKDLYRKGLNQFVPFVVTIAAILLTDLLKGMAIGVAIGLYFVIRANFHAAISLTQDGKNYLLRLQKDVSFLNKALLRSYLERVEEDSYLIIDGGRAQFIDQDILETLQDFAKAAQDDNITVELKSIRGMNGNGSE